MRLSWSMRGGVTYAELLDRYSADDREAINDIIKENVKNTKETQMPLL